MRGSSDQRHAPKVPAKASRKLIAKLRAVSAINTGAIADIAKTHAAVGCDVP